MTSRQVAIFPFLLVFSMVLAADECETNHDNRQGAVNSVVFYTSGNENNQKTIEKLEEKMNQLEKRMAEVIEKRGDNKNIVQEEVQEVMKSHNTNDTNDYDTQQPISQYNPPPLVYSCDEIKSTWPNSVSDDYLIKDGTGQAQVLYCSMENTCGDAKGGWMRVGYLNMSDPSEQCPPGFRLYEENGVRACGKQQSGAGCQSVKFPSYSISYSQVCGRVIGYQKGSPDAIDPYGPHNDISQAYVDGVSITRGNPRKHVWTFMAALTENSHLNKRYSCPCAPDKPVTPQSFVGNDYFCESGNPKAGHDTTTLHTNDPLWDGKQCGLIEKACCLTPGLPWFNKQLPQPTTDYIELRVCVDDGYEDSPVGYYEIYVK